MTAPFAKPTQKPARPFFSSGPCAKRPGWTPAVLNTALIGRSHRSSEGRKRLADVVAKTKAALHLPAGYEVAIVPGSDTGAFEMAMWNLLGPRGVDVFAWDVFGRIWLKDALDELKLADVRSFEADWGSLPDFSQADFSRDVVLTWNGTTTGVKVPNSDWIDDRRDGLVLVDATSGIFAEPIDIAKIDVITFSWQKALGGEAAHGMLILSPRALMRLAHYQPPWPLPKIFRLKGNGKILTEIFEGVTINTPSMLCVEDCLDALDWIARLGGLEASIALAKSNAAVVYNWLDGVKWAVPLPRDASTRSHTSVCLRFSDRIVSALDHDQQYRFAIDMGKALADEGVAYDITSYRGVPPGLRIWTGSTVEKSDLVLLVPWLDWAFNTTKSRFFI